MNVDSTVLDVLSNAVIANNALTLTGQLDRKLYEKTNKVLEAAGGKWNRKAKAHLFEGDAASLIDQIILTGEITNKKDELGYFPTPKPIVARLIRLAKLGPGMLVLEPSAGRGAIVSGILDLNLDAVVDYYEIDEENYNHIPIGTGSTRCMDFLKEAPQAVYDRVVMNPPFAKQQDIEHVMHAFKFLKPHGGRLVSVMSAGVVFRTNRMTTAFRNFVDDNNGSIEPLPADSFKESGTGVSTVIVTLET